MPSLIALVDSATPSRSRRMSLSLSRPGGLDHAEGHHLGRAAGRAGGDALALEVGHLLDAPALDRHDMHAVRIEHHQGAHLDRVALELVLALERIERGIDHHQRDFALLRADQLEIVDRAAGHARGRRIARHILRQHVRHAAAERIVDAAGAAGRDRDRGLLREGALSNSVAPATSDAPCRPEISCDPSIFLPLCRRVRQGRLHALF